MRIHIVINEVLLKLGRAIGPRGLGGSAVESSNKRLAVVDANDLRRAGVARLLAEWAEANGLVVTEVSPDALLVDMDDSNDWQMVVVSVGSGSVSTPGLQKLLRVMHALSAGIPAIILSDREDPSEIVLAYRAACRGFVPTTMEPKLALLAMSFILGGGSFFPPSALRLIGMEFFDESDGNGNPPPPPARRGPGPSSAGSPSVGCSETDTHNLDDAAVAHLSEYDIEDAAKCGIPDLPPIDEPNSQPDDELTCRQRQVLGHLRRGCPNKIIARELGVTEGTVKVHVRQIMRKLGAANRTHAAVLCGATILEQNSSPHDVRIRIP